MLTTEQKNNILISVAHLLDMNREAVLHSNEKDVHSAPDDKALVDRLRLDNKKIDGMIASLHQVASGPDPVGKCLYEYFAPNGLQITNKTVPFGKILIIYESRPDVTIEAAATAFKAGNYILLKGGKESLHTNLALTGIWHSALSSNEIPVDRVRYLDLNREETKMLILENREKFDLIIPRGGEALIQFVQKNTTVPVLISGRGNNFLYIHEDADIDMATNIIIDGKKRISVCNALDKVLFHESYARSPLILHDLVRQIQSKNISVVTNDAGMNAFHPNEYTEGNSVM